MQVDLSVIIVTWNGWGYVRECLKSAYVNYPRGRKEIIVVDNASTDGTPERVAEQFPSVVLIRNEVNRGFATANNQGIAVARGRYLCLVNSDVTIPPECLERMIDFMDEHPRVGLLGPQMIGPSGMVRRSTMRFPTLWNCFCRALALDSIFRHSAIFPSSLMCEFKHDQVKDVEVLNGWFWLVRRDAIDDVGGLDEQFFMYGEDIDWCRRFHNAKWRVVFYPAAAAVHYGGASAARAPFRFYIEMQRATVQYWRKHHRRLEQKLFLLIVLLQHSVRIVGYAGMYLVRSTTRPEAGFKIRRSALSILWLTGLCRVQKVNVHE